MWLNVVYYKFQKAMKPMSDTKFYIMLATNTVLSCKNFYPSMYT